MKELGTTGAGLRLPCIRSNHDAEKRRGYPLCECPHLQWPTLEASKAHEEEVNEHLKKMDAVMKSIDAIRKEHKGKNWRGVIICPACGGKLHLSHCAYNNRMRGTCETPDCCDWIE